MHSSNFPCLHDKYRFLNTVGRKFMKRGTNSIKCSELASVCFYRKYFVRGRNHTCFKCLKVRYWGITVQSPVQPCHQNVVRGVFLPILRPVDQYFKNIYKNIYKNTLHIFESAIVYLELNKTSAREFMNQTITIAITAIVLPKIMLSRSVAADGFKNILTLRDCQTDSVHVEYKPDLKS